MSAMVEMKASQWRKVMLERYRLATLALHAMSPEERGELEAWERANLDGRTLGTMDWPGWVRYIPDMPDPPKPSRPPSFKKPIPQSFRTRVFERDRYRCVICGDWHGLQVDHIVPESLGGELTIENCQTLCRACNLKKGARA